MAEALLLTAKKIIHDTAAVRCFKHDVPVGGMIKRHATLKRIFRR